MKTVIGKTELVKTIAAKLDTGGVRTVEKVTDALFSSLVDLLAEGNSVVVKNFGKFTVIEKAQRKGRNPQTGEELTIPAHKTIHFVQSKTFKDKVN